VSTWIAWPPEDAKTKFPQSYWEGDPLDEFQDQVEQEACPKCGFTVQFISDKHQYEEWNAHSHELIREILEHQRRLGDRPAHPKPNWMV
jgi:hypothetical protein